MICLGMLEIELLRTPRNTTIQERHPKSLAALPESIARSGRLTLKHVQPVSGDGALYLTQSVLHDPATVSVEFSKTSTLSCLNVWGHLRRLFSELHPERTSGGRSLDEPCSFVLRLLLLSVCDSTWVRWVELLCIFASSFEDRFLAPMWLRLPFWPWK